mmetsp:Transcript_139695/g.243217  ORF Transcript_139695/g.243217 Transcript_139695/m.243217 type:complete len:395 (+) Transcript_139695:93-1277(+)
MKGAKPMDALKAALAERQAKAQKTIAEKGQKWVRRSEIEQKRQEEYLEDLRREEERKQAEDEARVQKLTEHLSRRKAKEPEEQKKIVEIDESLLDDDDAEPPLEIETVIERLRELGLPITLFGETDMVRYRRLRRIEKEQFEGKKNPDLLMLEQHQQKLQKEEMEAAEELFGGAAEFQQDAVPDDKSDSEDDDEEKGAKTQARAGDGIVPEKPAEPEEAPPPEVDTTIMDRCDFIRSYLRKALKAWEKELAERPEDDKKKATTKVEIAQHRQARRDVRPLQKRLRVYRLDPFMLEKLHGIVSLAEQREYRQAAEAYIDLSIGKAAWPVGIGCGGSMLMEDAIGLHDRFNRMSQVKDIAHALNDEVARKYVQALKRLMTVAQRYWPAIDPSKAST